MMKKLGILTIIVVIIYTLIFFTFFDKTSRVLDTSYIDNSSYSRDIDESKYIKLSSKNTEFNEKTKKIDLVYTNDSFLSFTYVKEPSLEVKVGKKWKVVPYDKNNITFREIARVIKPKTEFIDEFIIKNRFVNLTPNKYRIIAELYAGGKKELAVFKFKIK